MTAAERSPIRVVGRYALYSEIAAGGMATIHLGRLLGPVGFARTVAVKRLHPQFAKDPEFVSMFLDEARLAARVQHPNVVATIDVVATDGELFLIMDYVRGESLSKLIRMVRTRGMQVPPRIAAAIICGFLHGLHAAHEAKNERGEPLGLVHRDVSPQNVLVGSDGIARVLDFGIAKAAGRIQVTRDGQIKGKLAYMPPEQLAGRELSRAVDIYAAAVVMWEALTAERLFKGDSEAETLAKILRDPVLPPSALVSSIPRAFDAPLLRALDRDASRRQRTAKELALELERCCGIASPSEVGEWVDEMVGPILVAREEQIAVIESNSAGMSVSQSVRPPAPGEDSDSDLSMPSARAILAAQLAPAPPRSARGSARASGGHPPADLGEEGTSSLTRTGMTALFSLPVDQKLPILASIAGILVLLVVVGFIVAGRFAASPAVPGVSVASAAPAVSAASAVPGTATDRAAATPSAALAASAEPAASVTPPDDPEPEPKSSASRPLPSRPPPVTHTAKPPTTAAPTRPSATSTASPPATKKNCEPNYTVDATGHKKYKLECM